MIVGDAFKRLFTGLTVDITTDAGTVNRAVQCHYGDHKELVKWITLRTVIFSLNAPDKVKSTFPFANGLIDILYCRYSSFL